MCPISSYCVQSGNSIHRSVSGNGAELGAAPASLSGNTALPMGPTIYLFFCAPRGDRFGFRGGDPEKAPLPR